jgi:hypothetical protein
LRVTAVRVAWPVRALLHLKIRFVVRDLTRPALFVTSSKASSNELSGNFSEENVPSVEIRLAI